MEQILKKYFLGFVLMFVNLPAWSADTATVDDTRMSVAAQPRLVRENPVPQVFFEEGGSFYISTASVEAYNRVMNTLNVAMRSHTKAHLIVNRRTNTIIDADGIPAESKVTIYDDSDDSAANSATKNAGPNAATPAPGAQPGTTPAPKRSGN